MKTLEQAHQEFNYEQLIQEQLVGQPNAINAYIECCQRYVGLQKTALIWEGKNGESEQWSFEQLDVASAQLANYFKKYRDSSG